MSASGKPRWLAVAIISICFSCPWGATPAAELARKARPQAGALRIGVVASMFHAASQGTASMLQPFGAIMDAKTGVHGELVMGRDVQEIARKLAENKLQLGVFQGVEFAWAKQTYPELIPLCIAVNQASHLRACIVVRDDCLAGCTTDLRNGSIAIPCGNGEHCRLFLDRACGKWTPKQLFAKISEPASVEDALDDVVDGIAKCSVVDDIALGSYRRRKPGRFARLKILEISNIFPAAVVAYRVGSLSNETLDRLRKGMLDTNKTALGKQMLTLWQMTGFENVPDDYNQVLTEVAKHYSPLEQAK